MSSTFIVNLRDIPELSANGGTQDVPGVGKFKIKSQSITRFLGDEKTGPWVYHVERPTGDVVALHKHQANRIEFLIDGKIEWHEPNRDPVIYDAGTMSYVEAGTVYGFTVLEAARILVIFEGPPGYQYM